MWFVGRFEANQLLFADDKAQLADSEEKLCNLIVVGVACVQSVIIRRALFCMASVEVRWEGLELIELGIKLCVEELEEKESWPVEYI